MALGGLSYAGGDTSAVVEPIIEVPSTIEEVNHFYVGLGLSDMNLNNDFSDEEFSATGIMLQAGYQLNKYFAIEGRYTVNVGDLDYDHGNDSNLRNAIYDGDYPGDFSNFGLYVKPMYAFDNFAVYALLGYGEVSITNLPYPDTTGSVDRAEDGFQWGLGGEYTFMDDISIFVDYVRLYDDKGFDGRAQDADITSDLWTLGVSYKF